MIFGWRCDSMYRGMKYRDASVHRCIVPGLISMCSGDQGGVYCDLESAAAGTVGQRAAWPHKNY